MYGTSAQSARKCSGRPKDSGSGFTAGSFKHAASVRQRFCAMFVPSAEMKALYWASRSAVQEFCPLHTCSVGLSTLAMVGAGSAAGGILAPGPVRACAQASVWLDVETKEMASTATSFCQLRLFISISVILDPANGSPVGRLFFRQ